MATDNPIAEPASQSRRGPAFRPRDLLLLVALLAAVGVLAALIIHGPNHQQAIVGQAGLAITPKPEPPLVLSNYLGGTVNIDSYRGKAVLVTFLYTHCPDICPLIASHLHSALADMSATERAKVQIIAVSVDPARDTPSAVAAFLQAHGMTGKMKYLIGSSNALARVWEAWGVGAKRDVGDPSLVSHTALVYGITAKGKITTIFPSNFAPAQLAQAVNQLAAA